MHVFFLCIYTDTHKITKNAGNLVRLFERMEYANESVFENDVAQLLFEEINRLISLEFCHPSVRWAYILCNLLHMLSKSDATP